MASKLFIVESPAKAKTIGGYLGNDYKVMASVGHVRDLPTRGLSIKIKAQKSEGDWEFVPTYEISPAKKKVVDELRKAAKSADEIILAPDPDREGEAIAWHLGEVLGDAAAGKPIHRVTYNEITRAAVRQALTCPRDIDLKRVEAQQARRILDRLVGFKVSPMLWRNLPYGNSLSAGRVQSVALRLLVEREREIKSFVPQAYWIMGVEACKNGVVFSARLARIDGEKSEVLSNEHAAMIVDDLDGSKLIVDSLKSIQKTRNPYPPFTTSTMQQSASSVCGLSPNRTMSLAQKLYESGLITYMRTDSVNVAESARNAAAKLIVEMYGKEYLPAKPNIYRSKSNAQQAHEAIRPTDVSVLPQSLQLDTSSAKLYDLIWRRFVASQMASARLNQTVVTLNAEKENLRHAYQFTASNTVVDFDGCLRVSGTSLVRKRKPVAEDQEEGESDEVSELPPLKSGEQLAARRWLSDRKETKPPPRYSEASLVKTLEENGVGRPSTYAQTIEVLVDRQYAERESRQLVPTRRGEDVTDWLVKRIEPLFNVGYTAEMESELDKVEDGSAKCNEMLSSFYRKFTNWLTAAKDPPPPREKFEALFSILSEVKEWKEPMKVGGRTYSDELFVKSIKEQLSKSGDSVSERQLQALAKIAVEYRDQVPDSESRLVELGYGSEIEKSKNAPSKELIKWCFMTIARIGGLERNPFLNSLREQVARGRLLTDKQFAILARTVGENAGALDDCEEIRAKLKPYVSEGFDVGQSDPLAPELLRMLDSINEWQKPVKRGRRTYNDAEFVASLKEQFTRRGSLSTRQVIALKRVIFNYRAQIPDFEANAERLGFGDMIARRKAAADKSSETGDDLAD